MNWNRSTKAMRKAMRKDRVLRAMGLEERWILGDILGGAGIFALGVLVGAGIGLAFAPQRGTEMRNMMSERWRNRRMGAHEESGMSDLRPVGAQPPAVLSPS